MNKNITLNINEIFYSIQGESTRAGMPCVFVRTQGCMLRCTWCDTDYALELKHQANIMSVEAILTEVSRFKCNFIELTGGEPLAQANTLILAKALCDAGYETAIETNGHADVSQLDTRVIKIMDFKCPASGMSKSNNFNNINFLSKKDEVKFVISDKQDFDWACGIIKDYDLPNKVKAVIVSPVLGSIVPRELAEMVLACNLNIRLQLQMHKYIWDPKQRGV